MSELKCLVRVDDLLIKAQRGHNIQFNFETQGSLNLPQNIGGTYVGGQWGWWGFIFGPPP